MILTTSPQAHGTGYRAVVSRELRSATGDVLNVAEADFSGF